MNRTLAATDAIEPKKFDDKAYWKQRHARDGSLKASGLKSVNLAAVHYIYRILEEQYLKLLKRTDMDSVKTALDCGFGDGYFLRFFKSNFPKLDVEGVDISQDAKDKIKLKIDKNKLHISDLASFRLAAKFDLVHCFDVLYHILDERDYRKSLENLADHSNKYVILHERFYRRTPIFSSRHVRFRRREVTDQILNSKGFFLHSEIATHFLGVRLFTYWLNKFIPSLLYKVDSRIANRWPDHLQEAVSTHAIRVYKKA